MPDLSLCEREWFSYLAETISAHAPGSICAVGSADRQSLRKLNDETPWIVTHDWKSAVRFLGGRTPLKQPTYCSLLGLPAENSFMPLLPWRVPKLPENLHLICHSELDRRFLVEFSGLPDTRVKFVDLIGMRPNPLRKNSPSKSSGNVLVGTLAPFVTEQNLNYFIAVAHYVLSRHTHVQFRMFGGGPLYAHLVKVVSELGISERCEIVEIGELTDLSSLDIYLHVPLRAHHSIPLNLAAELGLPVISSEVNGISDYLVDGESGFVIPLNEVRPMGELILRLVEDQNLRTSLGAAFQRSVEKRSVMDSVPAKLASLLISGPPNVSGVSAAA